MRSLYQPLPWWIIQSARGLHLFEVLVLTTAQQAREYLRVPVPPINRRDLKAGVKLRVVGERLDATLGTLAEVESVGYVGTPLRCIPQDFI